MEAEAMPLPSDEITPPVVNMNFVMRSSPLYVLYVNNKGVLIADSSAIKTPLFL
jgi:hypothetical protein